MERRVRVSVQFDTKILPALCAAAPIQVRSLQKILSPLLAGVFQSAYVQAEVRTPREARKMLVKNFQDRLRDSAFAPSGKREILLQLVTGGDGKGAREFVDTLSRCFHSYVHVLGAAHPYLTLFFVTGGIGGLSGRSGSGGGGSSSSFGGTRRERTRRISSGHGVFDNSNRDGSGGPFSPPRFCPTQSMRSKYQAPNACSAPEGDVRSNSTASNACNEIPCASSTATEDRRSAAASSEFGNTDNAEWSRSGSCAVQFNAGPHAECCAPAPLLAATYGALSKNRNKYDENSKSKQQQQQQQQQQKQHQQQKDATYEKMEKERQSVCQKQFAPSHAARNGTDCESTRARVRVALHSDCTALQFIEGILESCAQYFFENPFLFLRNVSAQRHVENRRLINEKIDSIVDDALASKATAMLRKLTDVIMDGSAWGLVGRTEHDNFGRRFLESSGVHLRQRHAGASENHTTQCCKRSNNVHASANTRTVNNTVPCKEIEPRNNSKAINISNNDNNNNNNNNGSSKEKYNTLLVSRGEKNQSEAPVVEKDGKESEFEPTKTKKGHVSKPSGTADMAAAAGADAKKGPFFEAEFTKSTFSDGRGTGGNEFKFSTKNTELIASVDKLESRTRAQSRAGETEGACGTIELAEPIPTLVLLGSD